MMRTQRDRRRGAARGGALQLLFVRVRIMGVAVFIVREIVTTELTSASLRVFAPLAGACRIRAIRHFGLA